MTATFNLSVKSRWLPHCSCSLWLCDNGWCFRPPELYSHTRS